jgi:hypothetical protein
MVRYTFDRANSDQARQALADNRCESKHGKRHRTQKRAKVLVIQAGHDLPTSELLRAAAKGVRSSDISQREFGKALSEAMMKGS